MSFWINGPDDEASVEELTIWLIGLRVNAKKRIGVTKRGGMHKRLHIVSIRVD